jgi:type IV pilus assembly protein PilV
MNRHLSGGSSLIEVLITILILMVGLLGLAGLLGVAQTSQMEAYQRSQALILLKDIQDRINANRKNAASYLVASLAGGTPCPAAGASIASRDLHEWCTALSGAAEVNSGGGNAGAMLGARGCITQIDAGATGVPGQYLVAVAWQGLNKTAAPSITCGSGQYGDESKRRVVALPIDFADLN